MRASVYLLAIATLFVAGCSSSESTREPDREPFQLREYETFDPTGFEDPPPPDGFDIEHEVPESLMKGEVGSEEVATGRRQAGFRIQVFSSETRRQASEAVEQAIAWWTANLEDEPAVYLEYQQPRYKVRVGNFRTRAAAQEALLSLKSEFRSAFIVPSMITR
ncbi:MAG: SPOR domain-containing protein [Bacteroidota bacterium]